MKYIIHADISKELVKDHPEIAAKFFASEQDYYVRKEMRKGYRVMNFTKVEMTDEHADNFVKNLYTMYVYADIFKIPRFLKRHLLNKTRQQKIP